MDMRTKLVFALVAVALGSMLALGAFTYSSTSRLLKSQTLEGLEDLADTQKRLLETILVDWQDRVSLIASRTQLRLSLREYNQAPADEPRDRIARILEDALNSVEILEALTVIDVEGQVVATTGRDPVAESVAVRLGDPRAHPDPGQPVLYRGITVTDDGGLLAGFTADLLLEEERVGTLDAVLNGRDVVELAEGAEALGATGETMIVMRQLDGGRYVLHRRYPSPDPPVRVDLENPGHPLTAVALGREATYENIRDYRSVPVWMATRHVPLIDGGMAVKFDRDEEVAQVNVFRRELVRLGLSLSAFAILIGTVLGLHFARPVHDLADVATQIRDGELHARAEVSTHDEVGVLARAFNEMAAELERRLGQLRQFKTFFELCPDLLCIASTDGFFKRVNPAFETTLGWKAEDLLAKPFLDFVHPDDVEPTLREIAKLSAGIPTISFENRYRCADGSYKHLEWTSHPEADGTLYAVARDITELKELRRR